MEQVNTKPSSVFLRLVQLRQLTVPELPFDEFRALCDTWQQIRELEVLAKPAPAPVRVGRSAAGTEDVSESDRGPDQGDPSAAPQYDRKKAPQDDKQEQSPEAGALDGFEPVAAAKPAYTGYMSAIKNKTRQRLMDMRAAGLSSSRLLAAAGKRLSESDLQLILEAKPVHFDIYERLASILDEIDASNSPEEGC